MCACTISGADVAPRGGPGIGSGLCVGLLFSQHFQGEAGGSWIDAELSALVHPPWLVEFARSQGLRGTEMSKPLSKNCVI